MTSGGVGDKSLKRKQFRDSQQQPVRSSSDHMVGAGGVQLMPYTDSLRLRDDNMQLNTRMIEQRNQIADQRNQLEDEKFKTNDFIDRSSNVVKYLMSNMSETQRPMHSGYADDDDIDVAETKGSDYFKPQILNQPKIQFGPPSGALSTPTTTTPTKSVQFAEEDNPDWENTIQFERQETIRSAKSVEEDKPKFKSPFFISWNI